MEVKITKLADGSKLAVVVLPRAIAATTMAVIKAGPRYDPIDKTGLSHFVEHMLSRGSKKWPTKTALTSALERKGASDFAFSYHETNYYWIKSSCNEIRLAIESLVDRIRNPILREENINQEKDVIKEELKILRSNPEKLIWELWSETIWQGTPLGRFYLGSETEIDSFSREDIQDFRERYYRPERTVYVVSGDIDFKSTQEMFNSFLSARVENISNPPQEERIFNETKKKNQINLGKRVMENVYLAIGVPTVKFGDKDREVLDLIGAILAGGMSSRLRQKVMDTGLTYSIEYHTEYLSETGYLMIMFTTDSRKLKTALKIIFNEFEDLAKNSISSKELSVAQGFLSGTLQVNMETTYDWAKWYGDQLVYSSSKVKTPEEKVREILNIGPERINRVAQRYLNLRNIYIAVIGNILKKDIGSLLERVNKDE